MTKKLIFILCLFVFIQLTRSVYANTNGSDIIIIRVYHAGGFKGVIRIYKGNDQTEKIDLPKIDVMDENNGFSIVRNTLNKYTSDGYSIISFSASDFTSVYILEKK